MKSTGDNSTHAPSRGICRTVISIRETALRIAYLRDWILNAAVDRVAVVLNDLCSRSEQAEPIAREVLAALLPCLTDTDVVCRIDELRNVATRDALHPLSRFFRKRVPVPTPEPPPVIPGQRGARLTLGERRALARKPSRIVLDKLLRDPDPLVIRNLLANPRVTEDDVILIACYRPAVPEVMVQLARSPRWSVRPRIRLAIVMNPGSPPDVSVPMVGLLIRPELEKVARSPSVMPLVRGVALDILARRPPLPDEDDPDLQ